MLTSFTRDISKGTPMNHRTRLYSSMVSNLGNQLLVSERLTSQLDKRRSSPVCREGTSRCPVRQRLQNHQLLWHPDILQILNGSRARQATRNSGHVRLFSILILLCGCPFRASVQQLCSDPVVPKDLFRSVAWPADLPLPLISQPGSAGVQFPAVFQWNP